MVTTPFGQLIDVIHGDSTDILADDLVTDIKTRHDVQAVVLQAVVLHQCHSQTTGANDHRIVMLVESQKILKLGHEAAHLVADARLAPNVEKRQILGNLRRLHIKFLGYLGR